MAKQPQPQSDNGGLAKIGNSFANLFRRQHAQAESIAQLTEKLDAVAGNVEVIDGALRVALTRISELSEQVNALQTQLEAAADEDEEDE